jgi:hypothetical protein
MKNAILQSLNFSVLGVPDNKTEYLASGVCVFRITQTSLVGVGNRFYHSLILAI